ncbi:hypothetical protein MTR67_004228 [Solanum verrucosum]|uniref:Telomerase reverse transcriptase n=1 Tax=Solanum verrucosum TaxID=315347 RepID=A0AAF0PTR2_SOLVR|nr:hypothetical protein MTR67_004228 [Solanum verrucosum]
MPWCCRKICEMEKLSTETTVSAEVNSACCEVLPSREGQCYSNRHTPSRGKRKRLSKWLRQRKLRQLKAQGTHSLIPCMSSNTKDERLGDVKCDVILNSRPPLEKTNAWCSCCSVFDPLSEVKKEILIDRRTMLYKLDSCSSVFPSEHILYSLKPNSSGANELFKEIFGSLGVNVSTEVAPCMHRSKCNLIASSCLLTEVTRKCCFFGSTLFDSVPNNLSCSALLSPLPFGSEKVDQYHSIIKLLKSLIRKAHQCQHLRLLEEHCSAPSLDQDTKNIAATILKVHLVKTEKSMNDPTQFSISSISRYMIIKCVMF